MRMGWVLTIGLCFLAALFEGLDIQSMGVAAPRLAPAFHLDPSTLGLVMSTSTVGLMIGAALGGWASDRWGRKAVLVAAMAVLGVFSLLTAASGSVPALFGARLLAGIGLGGVFPSLIAAVADVAPSRSRALSLGVMYAGLPLGGALAGAVMTQAAAHEWRLVFQVGGVGPLAVSLLILLFMPRAALARAVEPQAEHVELGRLFGPRTGTTLLLWIAYFFTLFAIYIQLNWMPTFLHAKGLTLPQASMSAVILNVGAAIGSLIFGAVMDRAGPKRLLPVVYAGMAVSLLALVFVSGVNLLTAAFFAGLFVIGGQLVLYAMGPMLYAPSVRGAGVGAAVAAGRGGAILGPILAGAGLARGFSPNSVPLMAEPGLVAAAAAIIWLAWRQARTA